MKNSKRLAIFAVIAVIIVVISSCSMEPARSKDQCISAFMSDINSGNYSDLWEYFHDDNSSKNAYKDPSAFTANYPSGSSPYSWAKSSENSTNVYGSLQNSGSTEISTRFELKAETSIMGDRFYILHIYDGGTQQY